MSTIYGISNRGNSCYVASVIQCIRSCLCKYPSYVNYLDTNINSLMDNISGDMEDAHEYYEKMLSLLPIPISKRFTISYDKGVRLPYIMLNTLSQNNGDKILSPPEILCVYRVPSITTISDFSMIELAIGVNVHRYRIQACICFISGSQNNMRAIKSQGTKIDNSGIDHYYAVIRHGSSWIKCDDSSISYANIHTHYPMYMIFYLRM